MNEFSKKEKVNLPGEIPGKFDLCFDVVVRVRQADGAIVAITGPPNMAMPVVIDVLATAIKGMAIQMIQQAQPKPLIEVPNIVMPKNIRADG
jgi:hypothetical protein